MIEYDEREHREAEALALALEGRRSSDRPDAFSEVGDALEAAALLRYDSSEGQLGAQSQARIERELFADIERDAEKVRETSRTQGGFSLGVRFWTALTALGGAACALVLWISLTEDPSEMAATQSASAPDRAKPGAAAVGRARGEASLGSVLNAQTALAAAPTLANLDALDQAMTPLRSSGLSATDAELDSLFQSGLEALKRGDADGALSIALRGLSKQPKVSPFAANLYLLQGQAYADLEQIEQSRGSYYQALRINEELMREALDSEDK
jgi:tetratricopeptide (TPR) repeat protein